MKLGKFTQGLPAQIVYAHEWDEEKLQYWDNDIQEIKDTAGRLSDHIMLGSDGGKTTATAAVFGGAAGAYKGSSAGLVGTAIGAAGGAVAGAVSERAQACANCHI